MSNWPWPESSSASLRSQSLVADTPHSQHLPSPTARYHFRLTLGLPSQAQALLSLAALPGSLEMFPPPTMESMGLSPLLSTQWLKQIETKTEEKCQHNKGVALLALSYSPLIGFHHFQPAFHWQPNTAARQSPTAFSLLLANTPFSLWIVLLQDRGHWHPPAWPHFKRVPSPPPQHIHRPSHKDSNFRIYFSTDGVGWKGPYLLCLQFVGQPRGEKNIDSVKVCHSKPGNSLPQLPGSHNSKKVRFTLLEVKIYSRPI